MHLHLSQQILAEQAQLADRIGQYRNGRAMCGVATSTPQHNDITAVLQSRCAAIWSRSRQQAGNCCCHVSLPQLCNACFRAMALPQAHPWT